MATQKLLFELLEEQQEPFDVEAYLLENGCSSKRLERISSDSRSTKGRGIAVGFFRSILTKLVHGKAFGKAFVLDNKTSDESGRLSHVFSCFSETRARTPDTFLDSTCSRGSSGELKWGCMELESSKQHSPVSVLEFHNHRSKEGTSSSTSSFDSPRDVSAFTHYTIDLEKQLMEDCVREAEGRIWESNVCSGYEEIGRVIINEMIMSWQSLKGDVSSLSKLLGSDISELSKEWSSFGPETTCLGIEIESTIFEDIIDDIVLDILGSHFR